MSDVQIHDHRNLILCQQISYCPVMINPECFFSETHRSSDQKSLHMRKPSGLFHLPDGTADGHHIQITGFQKPEKSILFIPLLKFFYVIKARTEKEEEYVIAEVVGFQDSRLILMPVDSVEGVGTGCIVENTGHPLSVLVGEELLGHTLDGIGRMTDGTEEIHGSYYPLENTPPDPMDRRIISEVLPLGVKAVDGLITVGKGQRIGVFAGSGVGKSTLLGMFARNTKADINVIALIGERGREVREFIERDLGPEGMARSVVVVATSDKPALIRNKCAKTATAVAEYFRDQGKDVLLMMDSMTRFSQAQREIGLASGEPPVTRGYPPSVYAQMPKLLERAGTNEKGSITGLYTVLVDGDDFNEPITDTARGILDGHIAADLVMHSVFPEAEIEREKDVVLEEVASYRDTPSEAVFDDFEDLIFGSGSSMGHNILGTEDHITAMGSTDCARYLKEQYVPENMSFFYMGPADAGKVFREAEKQFGTMYHRLCRPARVTPAILPAEHKVVDFGLHQSHTIVGARVPGMYDDSRFALALLNNLLAGPGMNSLLNVLMRERRGLVYTVESSIASFTDCGLLEIYFGCEQNKVKKSLDIIGKTIDQLAQSPLSTSRLEAAKRQYCGQLLVASQSVESTALGAGKSVLYWNQVPNVDRTVERIKAVTAEQVRQAAELITPSHASILTFQ